MNKLTFKDDPASKGVAVPAHVGQIGVVALFENAVYEPVLVPVEGVFIDHYTGEDTDSEKWFKMDPDRPGVTIASGKNEQKYAQPNYPGTKIPAEHRGGGSVYAHLLDADGVVIKRKEIPVSAFPLEEQAKPLSFSQFARTLAAEEYGVTVSERPTSS